MDRLTERLYEGCYGVSACKTGCEHDNKYCGDAETTCPAVCDCFDKLGRLEDLAEAGRLVVLPEGIQFENILEPFRTVKCPSDFGLPEDGSCVLGDCPKCWEAALKGGGDSDG